MNLRFLTTFDAMAFKQLRLEGIKSNPKSYLHIYDEEIKRPDSYHEGLLENNKVVGTFDGDVLVGFAILTPNVAIKQRHKCTVWGAYVKPEYAGNGIGKNMRNKLFQWAKEQGIEYCLSSITSNNPASLGMHLGVGYEVMYTEKHGMKHRDGTYSDIIHLVKWL